jgi:hypothetical protein
MPPGSHPPHQLAASFIHPQDPGPYPNPQSSFDASLIREYRGTFDPKGRRSRRSPHRRFSLHGRNCGCVTSIPVGCDGYCLTHVVARCGPRQADTIGIRPVLPPAWKWQRIRNMCHDRYAPQIGNVRRQYKNARTAYDADDKGDEHVPTQFEIEHRSPLFDYLSAPSAPFRRVVAISSTLATVSGRLHRGPKVVSSRAELIHHSVRCGTSKQKRPPESGHGVEISVIPQRSVPMD